MFKSLIIATLIASVSSFNFGSGTKPETKFKFVGDTAPLGYFDPFSFIDNKSEGFLKSLREAELQHSRVAMTSMVVLPLIDYFSPNDNLAINYLSDHPFGFQIALLATFGYLESQRILKNYKNPFEGETPFSLKEDAEPGSYFNYNLEDDRLMNAELNNGRLAMIASFGYIVQELVTQQPIF